MDVKHLLDDQKSYRNAKKVFQMMRMSLTQPNDEQVVRRFMSFSPLVHTQFLLELHKVKMSKSLKLSIQLTHFKFKYYVETGPFLEQLTREIEQKKRRSSYELSELMVCNSPTALHVFRFTPVTTSLYREIRNQCVTLFRG